ncbi:GAF domain-containing protein [Fictibacillus fluitans]|uniref:GAF domain-containing protein n=1 Tax=Fictibacillus fluitans TaxID=3058422 RepID=A0ABT8I3W2_9BACL|nr:GAF domain-containing protein [Fictibacillus sp. NE201]MDN4527724.1 GAF domain-containing protein [Fictibacillus sp. NE201]
MAYKSSFLIELEKLAQELQSSFAGIALQDGAGSDVHWRYACGNRNEKYKKISVRYGKGIAGKVISTGRAIQVDEFPKSITGKAVEYPIMLAEQLVSAYAVPLILAGQLKGVLLVGYHQQTEITQTLKDLVQNKALRIEDLYLSESQEGRTGDRV